MTAFLVFDNSGGIKLPTKIIRFIGDARSIVARINDGDFASLAFVEENLSHITKLRFVEKRSRGRKVTTAAWVPSGEGLDVKFVPVEKI